MSLGCTAESVTGPLGVPAVVQDRFIMLLLESVRLRLAQDYGKQCLLLSTVFVDVCSWVLFNVLSGVGFL